MVGTRTDNFYALYATLDANNVIAGAPGDSLLQVNADAFVACLGSIRELPDDTPPYDVRFDYNLDSLGSRFVARSMSSPINRRSIFSAASTRALRSNSIGWSSCLRLNANS